VDENVDAAPPGNDGSDRVRDGDGEGHIAADRERMASTLLDVGGDRLTSSFVAGGEGHARAFICQTPRDRFADATRGAGDESDPACQPPQPRRIPVSEGSRVLPAHVAHETSAVGDTVVIGTLPPTERPSIGRKHYGDSIEPGEPARRRDARESRGGRET